MSGPTRENLEPIMRTLHGVAAGAIGAGVPIATVVYALISVASMIAGVARGLSASRQVDMTEAMLTAMIDSDPGVAAKTTAPGGEA